MNTVTKLATAGITAVTILASAQISLADTRLIIGGTKLSFLEQDESWRESQYAIGANWVPNASAVAVVDYPASPGPVVNDITMDSSVLLGVSLGMELVEQQLALGNGPMTIVGLSQGGMVADRMLTRWASDSGAPSPNQVRFVMIGNPVRGLFQMLDEGLVIQGLGITVFRPTETPYDVDVIVGEYDGLADPPDRFWNLLALSNAILGVLYVHSSPDMVAPNQDDTLLVDRVVNTLGGTTTTYMRPTPFLPLTMPLRQLDMEPRFVDALDEGLRPIIDSAYVRHDIPAPATADTSRTAPPVTDTPAPAPSDNADSAAPDVRQGDLEPTGGEGARGKRGSTSMSENVFRDFGSRDIRGGSSRNPDGRGANPSR